MTLRKPARLLFQRVKCGWSLTVNQSPPPPFARGLGLTLGLIATLLVITLLNAPLASAQDVPPARPANTQVSPSSKPVPRQHDRSTWHAPKDTPKDTPKDAPKEAGPKPAEVATPVASPPAETPAATAQPADDRLPFMTSNERDSHEQPSSAAGLLLRTLGALLLIVGLIVAAAWGMKRFGGARFGTPQEDAPPLAVLNSLSLGERRSLTIVRFGDRTLLLGSTAHSVTLLAEAESDDFPPRARSVADILNEDKPMAFANELFSATEQLDVQMERRRGDNSTI
jgi:flagellar biosynthetic protein FliO